MATYLHRGMLVAAAALTAACAFAQADPGDWMPFSQTGVSPSIRAAWTGKSQSLFSAADVARLEAFRRDGWQLASGEAAFQYGGFAGSVGLVKRFGGLPLFRDLLGLIKSDGNLRLKITKVFCAKSDESGSMDEGILAGDQAAWRQEVKAAFATGARGRLTEACMVMVKELKELGWSLSGSDGEGVFSIAKKGRRSNGSGELYMVKIGSEPPRLASDIGMEPDELSLENGKETLETRANYEALRSALQSGSAGRFERSDFLRLRTFIRLDRLRFGRYKESQDGPGRLMKGNGITSLFSPGAEWPASYVRLAGSPGRIRIILYPTAG